MCLILLAHKVHPKYPLIVAANRDEFYSRPTRPAEWWDSHPGLLGGKDLIGGGSWFGVNKNGNFAALTNIREPDRFNKDAPSRGPLVTEYLLQNSLPGDYLEEIAASNKNYNGFNLLIGNAEELHYFSNRSQKYGILDPGIYGLSNHLLNTPWPKVEKGKGKLKKMIIDDNISTERIFDELLDKNLAKDTDLPSTGVPIEWERALSAMFIEMEGYGTRCSTLLLVDDEQQVTFSERNFIPEDERMYHFKIQKT